MALARLSSQSGARAHGMWSRYMSVASGFKRVFAESSLSGNCYVRAARVSFVMTMPPAQMKLSFSGERQLAVEEQPVKRPVGRPKNVRPAQLELGDAQLPLLQTLTDLSVVGLNSHSFTFHEHHIVGHVNRRKCTPSVCDG